MTILVNKKREIVVLLMKSISLITFMIVWVEQLGINMTNDRLQTPQVAVEEIVCDDHVALGIKIWQHLVLAAPFPLCVVWQNEFKSMFSITLFM